MAKLPDATQPARALSVRANGGITVHRDLAEEMPVAMVYDGTTHAVMMASPADIEDFAIGFSLTEGIITDPAQILEHEVAVHPNGIEARMWLADPASRVLTDRRRSLAGPVGCGLCGIDSLEQVIRDLPDLSGIGPRFRPWEVAQATDALRDWQPLHDRTHAVHAAGFLRPGGAVLMAREDVGRHNALDKLIGALIRAGVDPAQGAFVLTSRISVEMVQKSAMAGCAVIIAVSAPTANALRIADAAGMTLAAFARSGRFELFSHPERLQNEVRDVA